jgi:NitT/TauT family transport system substrate-binding protein
MLQVQRTRYEWPDWRGRVSRRSLGQCLAAAITAAIVPSAYATEAVVVGALRFSSSGPLFIARDRGYFAAAQLDVDIRFFEAAPGLALAAAAGDLTFGLTALTGAFFNLAGRGGLRILAGQAREERGRPGNLILVRKSAFDAGLDSLPALFSQPFGLTQVGSPSHYQLGQLARMHGVDLRSVQIRAFQSLPNLVAAIRGGHVGWAIIGPPIASDLVAGGEMVALAPYSDYGGYQFGVLFAPEPTIEKRTTMVRRFLGAYVKGLQDYAVLNEARPANVAASPEARAVAAIIARYVYPNDQQTGIQKVLASPYYVDPSGRVDVEDVERQIKWYQEQRLVRAEIGVQELLRLDLLP